MSSNKKNRITTLLEIFLVSLRLGLTSFGGPIAHLGYFHDEYVRRRKWLDEQSYADLVALCQFLPGPASSQVGIGIGIMRAGILGGLTSFIGFTAPSVIVLITFALLLQDANLGDLAWISGLKLVAVAVVAHAILGMAQKLTPDVPRRTIALIALAITLLWQQAFTQVGVILLAGVAGFLIYRDHKAGERSNLALAISPLLSYFSLTLFFCILILLPILREVVSSEWVAMFDSFYRAGSLVFGGGHVVLPLLEREFVPGGWLSSEAFLAGYGAAQAVPGPLFTFGAYLGTIIAGWKGGLLATLAIFLPAILLVVGIMPFWDSLRRNPKIQGALLGVNAAVVGILIAAFYNPIWTSAIKNSVDFIFAATLFSMLSFWRLPSWVVVIAGIIGGLLII